MSADKTAVRVVGCRECHESRGQELEHVRALIADTLDHTSTKRYAIWLMHKHNKCREAPKAETVQEALARLEDALIQRQTRVLREAQERRQRFENLERTVHNVSRDVNKGGPSRI